MEFTRSPNKTISWWVGNWANRGYDVYAYFATFSGGNGKGTGDFEVDYQDTSNDFWQITGALHPVAILSFGQGDGPWELEYNARNKSSWQNDYESPYDPTPAPPDDSVPAGTVRNSTLPVQAIADAVNSAGIGVNAWVDWDGNPGGFLCEYMAYHDAWYQDLHSDPSDPYWCVAAGFTHVSGSLTVAEARDALGISLRETIGYVDSATPEPATMALMGLGGAAMLLRRRKK